MTNNTRRFTADMFNDPLFVGFDRLVNRMHQATPGQTNNYPPYNIVKIDEYNYSIELAVAGFVENEIDVEVKDGTLSVIGEKNGIEEGEYLHKGISARTFHRSFTLSDTIVVRGANMEQGILKIDLENVIPEEKKPRKIDIGKKDKSLLKG